MGGKFCLLTKEHDMHCMKSSDQVNPKQHTNFLFMSLDLLFKGKQTILKEKCECCVCPET